MVDVVSDQTEISYAESTTGWSGDSFTLDTEILVQNANSVSCIQTANGVNDAIFTKATGSWDMSGKHLRMYLNTNIAANMAASNAIQLFAGDGTNTAYWTVANAAANYAGGWQDFFLDVDSTPTSGSVNTAAITHVGVRINTATKPRNAINGWYDNWRFGNGLEINSDASEAISFSDVATNDALTANKYDILQNIDDVLFGKGKITLGNAAAAKNCNLVSVNEQIVFIDRVVTSTLYALVATEGTGTTTIDLTGLICKTVGTSGAELDFSSQISNISIVSCTFIGMGTMNFVQASVSTSIQSNGFTSCGLTSIGSGMTFSGCTWIQSKQITAIGTVSDSDIDSCIDAISVTTTDLSLVTGNHFISDGSNHAVELTSIGGGSMTWNNTTSNYDTGATGSPVTPTSTGNEDIYVNVATASDLTINVAAGATTPSIRVGASFTGSVNVVAGSVSLTISANVSLVGAEIAIYDMDTTPPDFGTELAHTESHNAATYIYSGTASNLIRIQILFSGYEEFSQETTMPTADGAFSAVLEVETN